MVHITNIGTVFVLVVSNVDYKFTYFIVGIIHDDRDYLEWNIR